MVMLDPAKYKARPRVPEPAGDGSSAQPKWQVGEQEYEALMRMLDNLVSVKEKGGKATCQCWFSPNIDEEYFCLPGLQNGLPLPLPGIARQR